MNLINQKYNKVFIVFVKTLVVALSFWFLYTEIRKEYFNLQFSQIQQYVYINPRIDLFLLVFVLSVLNLLLDVYKWHYAIRFLSPIPFISSIKSVLTGMSIGLLTPNSIGEFIGRILHLKDSDKAKGTVIYFIVSLSQLAITIMAACLCSLYYFYFVQPLSTINYLLIASAGLSIALIVLFLVYRFDRIIKLLSKSAFLKNRIHVLDVYSIYSIKDLSLFLFISLIKYICFTSQYILMYYLLGFDGSVITLFSVLSLIFISQSILPVFSLFDVGVKGSLALLFLKPIGIGVSAILFTTFSIWMLNVILPSVIGLFLFINAKYTK